MKYSSLDGLKTVNLTVNQKKGTPRSEKGRASEKYMYCILKVRDAGKDAGDWALVHETVGEGSKETAHGTSHCWNRVPESFDSNKPAFTNGSLPSKSIGFTPRKK